jgi:hypothetical protein
MPDDAIKDADAIRACDDLLDDPERMSITKYDLWALVINTQLALRHPRNAGAGAAYAAAICRAFGQSLKASHPILARIIEQGFDPRRDVGRSAPMPAAQRDSKPN